MNKIYIVALETMKVEYDGYLIYKEDKDILQTSNLEIPSYKKVIEKEHIFKPEDEIENVSFKLYYVLEKDLRCFKNKIIKFFEMNVESIEKTIKEVNSGFLRGLSNEK